MQVYKKMDIGTDKYDTEKLGIHQYMTDMFNPSDKVTALKFRNICRNIINDIFFDKKIIPLLAGGSGLYIRAVIDDLEFLNGSDFKDHNNIISESQNLYKTIHFNDRLNKDSKDYELLKKIDPVYASKISINDTRRISRALEVYDITNRPFSDFQKKWNERKSVYNTAFIGISKKRENLHRCIENRITEMIELGLIDEVKSLIELGFGNFNSMKQAVGYKEVISFLEGECTIDESTKKIIKNTKRLAKKQMTWFNADHRINWIRADNYDNIIYLISDVIKIIWKDLINEKN
ncbi:MAG: tRNA (adenosine(37)-N6)-dimethylallyltransferase MiaA, partial [Actinobacteria bacterium]|nr:tRNA (adenosine(37)-N6)-dimethylallyltransferase MiaA [Actinomycetota bacterium]